MLSSTRGVVADGLAEMSLPKGSIIAFSCAPRHRAFDKSPNQRNGLYTYHLLKHLDTIGLSVHSLFVRINQGVEEQARRWGKVQEPYLNDHITVENASLMPNT